MNTALVFNLTGIVLVFSSLFMLVPFFVSLGYKGPDVSSLGMSFVIHL